MVDPGCAPGVDLCGHVPAWQGRSKQRLEQTLVRATEVQQQPSVAVCARSGGIAGAVEGSRPQWWFAPAVAVCAALARFSDRKRATTMVVLAMMMMMMVVVVVVVLAAMVMMMKMVIVVVAAIMIVVSMMMRA